LDPSKYQDNCREVQVPEIFGLARPSKFRETAGKNCISRIFQVPSKNHGTPREDPKFEPCSSWENCKEFLDKPVLQNPKTLRKNPHFENFLDPLKIAGNQGKIQNVETCTSRKNCKKVRISKPVTRISQLANSPIFLLFLLTSALK
jgi:hypothetical protein